MGQLVYWVAVGNNTNNMDRWEGLRFYDVWEILLQNLQRPGVLPWRGVGEEGVRCEV